MRDPWYGHREPVTFEPMGDRDEKIDWDYALISALQLIEDHTDKSSGLPVWVVESERVDLIAEKRTDKFQAAVERKTSGTNYKPSKGERFSPKVHLRGGEYPTYKEFVEGLQSGDTD